MKKTLNTAELENQLAGSVFFKKTKPSHLPVDKQHSKEAPSKPHFSPRPRQRHSPPAPTRAKNQVIPHEEINRTSTPNERTVQPNGDDERSSVLTELEEGVRESKRPTERYSFEIYVDMKEKIEDIQYQYKKKTGKKLSASRIIRRMIIGCWRI